MKPILRRALAVLGAVIAMGGAVQAAPLNLVETTDFDTVTAGGGTLGTLSNGVNTISGTISFTCLANGFGCDIAAGGDTFDTVTLGIAPGATLLSNSLFSVTNASPGFSEVILSGTGGFFGSAAFGGPFGAPDEALISNLTVPTTGPADITFTVNAALKLFVTPGPQSFDYTFTFNVEGGDAPAVPLPASGVMLLSVLGLGAALRRRNRSGVAT